SDVDLSTRGGAGGAEGEVSRASSAGSMGHSVSCSISVPNGLLLTADRARTRLSCCMQTAASALACVHPWSQLISQGRGQNYHRRCHRAWNDADLTVWIL